MSNRLFFMIEGGQAQDLVKHHIAEVQRVKREAIAIGRELGAARINTSGVDGTLIAVQFDGTPHRDFIKTGKRGALSYRPRGGTEWEKRFAAQRGYESASYLIQEKLNVPCQISYSTPSGGSGFRHVSVPFEECGFLYLGAEGPYAMWIPDIEAEVAADLAKGHSIEEPALTFKPVFDGCRKIALEEWELLVARHNFAQICEQENKAVAGA
ncbi:hypothetical protein [Burkholderia pseudomallei]|uniref:hypothetical protein n=1 Tax=Burkholderia pseudomallei TaxID=28450 RepID=UPI000A1A2276|nr:hypothetical protein [Burkholderia pseudomallei]ARL04221.1 hypothetical protein BOC44_20805 [Burkholderia pseudomallei]